MIPAVVFGPRVNAHREWGVSPDGERVWSVHRTRGEALAAAAALRGGGPVPMHAARGFYPGEFLRTLEVPGER